MGRLEGKIALVTGGAAGIGEAAVRALRAEGAAVVIADMDAERGEALAAELGAPSGAEFVKTDVREAGQVQALMRQVTGRHGGLDVLFNNAGVSVPGSADELSESDWTRALDVNLSGTWRCLKAAIPLMLTGGGGSVINNASVQALVGFPGWAAYAASKGGVVALTRQAAVDYAPHRIRVNALAPGTIMTPMNERIFAAAPDPDALMRSWQSMHAMGRVGQAWEVAGAVVFLSSDEAAFITGVVLPVDGGLVVNASAGAPP